MRAPVESHTMTITAVILIAFAVLAALHQQPLLVFLPVVVLLAAVLLQYPRLLF